MTKEIRARGVVRADWTPALRGPEGRRLCKRCLAEVPKGRQFWCGQACVQAQLVARAPRHQVRRRDNGICASCAVDCLEVEREIRRATPERLAELRAAGWRFEGGWSARYSQWEADHIVPLAEGGSMEIENLRTLCVPCHKRETAALARRRAESRRAPARGRP